MAPADDDEKSGWTVAGFGCTSKLHAVGEERFSVVKASVSQLHNVLRIDSNALPAVRYFGGGAFVCSFSRSDDWADFGDAEFELSTWQYWLKSDSAYIRLCMFSSQFEAGDWRSDARQIDTWLRSEELQEMSPSCAHVEYGDGVAWREGVSRALYAISLGELQKVVLSRTTELTLENTLTVGAVLAVTDNSFPHCAVFVFRKTGKLFVGVTPERLVRVTNAGSRIATDVLAGSIKRGDIKRDNDARQSLLSSDKEQREFNFVYNDIVSRLTDLGVVLDTERSVSVRTLADVHHLYCRVEGRLQKGLHVLDLVSCLHPTPAVCGTPTSEARNWIQRFDGYDRGWYSGPVGWFCDDGDGDFFVGIRSALIDGKHATIFSGAGIVAGSDPDVEFQETAVKQLMMLRLLGAIRDEN